MLVLGSVLAFGSTLAMAAPAPRGVSVKLHEAQWPEYRGAARLKPLAPRVQDARISRRRFVFHGHFQETASKGDPDTAGGVYQTPTGTLVSVRPGLVVVAPRVHLAGPRGGPAPSGARGRVEIGFRALNHDLAHVALRDTAGRLLRLRIRPIFESRSGTDWALRLQRGDGRSDSGKLFLGDPTLAKTMAHEAFHAVFSTPDEYRPFLKTPMRYRGKPTLMADVEGLVAPEMLTPFAAEVGRAIRRRLTPVRVRR